MRRRAAELGDSSMAVVIAALAAEQRRVAIEREIVAYEKDPHDDDPDLALPSADHVAQVRRDLDQVRAIHLALVGAEPRPVRVLTRDHMRGRLSRVGVAPITSRVRGIAVEVPVGPRNGLDHDSVMSYDNIQTIAVAELGRLVGHLRDDQEKALTAAIRHAFDLS